MPSALDLMTEFRRQARVHQDQGRSLEGWILDVDMGSEMSFRSGGLDAIGPALAAAARDPNPAQFRALFEAMPQFRTFGVQVRWGAASFVIRPLFLDLEKTLLAKSIPLDASWPSWTEGHDPRGLTIAVSGPPEGRPEAWLILTQELVLRGSSPLPTEFMRRNVASLDDLLEGIVDFVKTKFAMPPNVVPPYLFQPSVRDAVARMLLLTP